MFKYSAVIVQLIFVHLTIGLNIESIDSAGGDSTCQILTSCSGSSRTCHRTIRITTYDKTIATEICRDRSGTFISKVVYTSQNQYPVQPIEINTDSSDFGLDHVYNWPSNKSSSQFSGYSIIMQFCLLCVLFWRLYH